jgi:phage pi2 protein 07
MSAHLLEKFLPDNTLPFLKVWFGNYNCHLKITRNRNSKLGDYRKMPDNSHQITINGTLEPQLFFFVLTHELAHLIAFEKYGRRISPHGQEWKQTFREMLLESLEAYQEDLKLIIKDFSKSPKANFMASPELVKYFHKEEDGFYYIENLEIGERFIFRKKHISLKKKLKNVIFAKIFLTGNNTYSNPLVRLRNYKIYE